MAGQVHWSSTELWELELRRHQWSNFRADGQPEAILEGFRKLIRGCSDEAAEDAATDVWSTAMSQNDVFEIAVPTAETALLLLSTSLEAPTVRRGAILVLDALAGVTIPPSDADESVGGRARHIVASGLWLYYTLLGDSDPEVRTAALGLVAWADLDRARAEQVLNYFANSTSDLVMRGAAEGIARSYWWRTREAV